jgi:hypothetical protein
VGVWSDVQIEGCNVGAQYRPSGKYLEGWFFALYFGAIHAHNSLGEFFQPDALAEIGYQWVWNSGFTLSIAAGACGFPPACDGKGVSQSLTGASFALPSVSLGVGWAVPDAIFRIPKASPE